MGKGEGGMCINPRRARVSKKKLWTWGGVGGEAMNFVLQQKTWERKSLGERSEKKKTNLFFLRKGKRSRWFKVRLPLLFRTGGLMYWKEGIVWG